MTDEKRPNQKRAGFEEFDALAEGRDDLSEDANVVVGGRGRNGGEGALGLGPGAE